MNKETLKLAEPIEKKDETRNALFQGDWDEAYLLSCREDRVRYLVTSSPPELKRRKKTTPH